MNKINIIIKREFNNRVRKKAFLIMSLLGPVLFSAMFIVPAYIDNAVKEPWNVVVVDKTGLTESPLKGKFKFQNSSAVIFNTDYLKEDYAKVKTMFFDSSRHSVIYLNEGIINPIKKKESQPKILVPTNFKDAPPSVVESTVKDQVREFVQLVRLNSFTTTESGRPTSDLLEVNVEVIAEDLESQNEKDKANIEFVLSIVGAFLIYLFVLLFGSTVMKGVSEEKNSRIIEVLISSVKPFQLMMGKIIGIGFSALAQFGIWILLSIVAITGFSSYFSKKLLEKQLTEVTTQLGEQGASVSMPSQEVIQEASKIDTDNFLNLLYLVDWPIICITFVLFFIGGYMLYSAMFAAIGSTLDVDTDGQQFVFPLTIPLIISLFIAMTVMENPDSSIAQWASFIPFTSPIVMMARIPFGVPIWQIAISIAILILTIFFTVKGAAKIYRTGILLYGQKITYKTLWKWLRH